MTNTELKQQLLEAEKNISELKHQLRIKMYHDPSEWKDWKISVTNTAEYLGRPTRNRWNKFYVYSPTKGNICEVYGANGGAFKRSLTISKAPDMRKLLVELTKAKTSKEYKELKNKANLLIEFTELKKDDFKPNGNGYNKGGTLKRKFY